MAERHRSSGRPVIDSVNQRERKSPPIVARRSGDGVGNILQQINNRNHRDEIREERRIKASQTAMPEMHRAFPVCRVAMAGKRFENEHAGNEEKKIYADTANAVNASGKMKSVRNEHEHQRQSSPLVERGGIAAG